MTWLYEVYVTTGNSDKFLYKGERPTPGVSPSFWQDQSQGSHRARLVATIFPLVGSKLIEVLGHRRFPKWCAKPLSGYSRQAVTPELK